MNKLMWLQSSIVLILICFMNGSKQNELQVRKNEVAVVNSIISYFTFD